MAAQVRMTVWHPSRTHPIGVWLASSCRSCGTATWPAGRRPPCAWAATTLPLGVGSRPEPFGFENLHCRPAAVPGGRGAQRGPEAKKQRPARSRDHKRQNEPPQCTRGGGLKKLCPRPRRGSGRRCGSWRTARRAPPAKHHPRGVGVGVGRGEGLGLGRILAVWYAAAEDTPMVLNFGKHLCGFPRPWYWQVRSHWRHLPMNPGKGCPSPSVHRSFHRFFCCLLCSSYCGGLWQGRN